MEPAKLFQILKDGAVKVLHSICQQIWKTQQWPQDRKRSVFILIPKKGNAKECSNYRTIALISHASWGRKWQPTPVFLSGKSHVWRNLAGCSPWGRKESDMTEQLHFHASKAMLKNLQARLQEYMNRELPDVQARFRKGKGNRDQIANIYWIIKKPREFQKTSISALLTTLSLWLRGSQQTGKFLKRWEYQTALPASWEICTQAKKQQLEPDMEQQTGSKLGKEYVKGV